MDILNTALIMEDAMTFLDGFMDLINWIELNGDVITVTFLAVLAGADKLALVFLKTISNIRDAWRDYFGPDRV